MKGSCHCGAVSFELAQLPKKLVDCNCTICRRHGALWGHVPIETVTITAEEGSTTSYVREPKTLAIKTCKNCGCTTHWESLEADGKVMGVNTRMCEPDDIKDFRIRRFDGLDKWEFID